MPLQSGNSPEARSANIAELIRAGHDPKQAEAIAYAKSGGDESQFENLGTVRHVDVDGKLHVAISHISKATVNPYYGREIPDSEALRLEPGKIYQLLRHPEELARAAPTANNLPIQDEHIAFLAADPPTDNIVGSTGTDACFNAPYLDNSLVIWVKESIDGIETNDPDEKKRELSCSYRYRADMTPGVYEGLSYDGIMRDIVFNHVALVSEGRAGSDVLVADAKGFIMPLTARALMLKGAMSAAVRPFLAADAKIDFAPVLKGVDGTNAKSMRATVLSRLAKACEGKITVAFDAKPILAAFDAVEEAAEDEDKDEEKEAKDRKAARDRRAKDRKSAMDAMRARDGEGEETSEEEEERKASDEAEDARRARDGEGEETEAEREERYTKDRKKAKDRRARDRRGNDEPPEFEGKPKLDAKDKKAMDAAIAKAKTEAKAEARAETIAQLNAMTEARELVEPHIGKVSMAVDSAEAIYRLALEGVDGVELDGSESVSALKSMVKMLRPPSETIRPARLAMDNAANDSYAAMFGPREKSA